MNAKLPHYEVYALRYATVDRVRNDNFIAHDPHDAPMPMDYFVWLIKGTERTILVDTGFNERAALDRQRTFIRCPISALASLGIAPQDVDDIIVTHLHYDHAGNLDLLPNARIHIQDAEVNYATGRYMTQPLLRHAYSVNDVAGLIKDVYAGRVSFYDGDARFAPGIELILIGGHTKGLQAVRVHTQLGWVVLASDASHFYENFMRASPFPIVHDIGEMLEGFDRLRAAADDEGYIVPGHDPQVLTRFPAVALDGDVVAIHEYRKTISP